MVEHQCGCGGNAGPVRYNAELVNALSVRARDTRPEVFADANVQTSLLPIGSGLALEVLSTNPAEKKSLIVFQKMGVFNALDIELCKFDINFPRVEVEICFKIDPLGGGAFKIEGKIHIVCEDILKPAACTVSIDLGPTSKEVQALINWDCLKRCAPQCISCGLDWQCWLGCAGGCIIQCL